MKPKKSGYLVVKTKVQRASAPDSAAVGASSSYITDSSSIHSSPARLKNKINLHNNNNNKSQRVLYEPENKFPNNDDKLTWDRSGPPSLAHGATSWVN